MKRVALLITCCCLYWVPSTWAHSFEITDILVILKGNRTYQIDITYDYDALALGQPQSADNNELYPLLQAMTPEAFLQTRTELEELLARRMRIDIAPHGTQTAAVNFPQLDQPIPLGGIPSRFGVIARFTGDIPDDAESFALRISRSFGMTQVTILDQVLVQGIRHHLSAGGDTPPYRFDTVLDEQANRSINTFVQYLIWGFEHIIPKGLDHILFVLALFLLRLELKTLLWQITAFTIAHSITLALSSLDILQLPDTVVEPLIAASIAFVAIENLFTTKLHPWRPALVFAFGLLHGLGFAGVLGELGLPRDAFITSLVAFNIGVELGQLTVVAIAFLLVGWFRNKPWYRKAIVIPGSLLIALAGLYWTIERTVL